MTERLSDDDLTSVEARAADLTHSEYSDEQEFGGDMLVLVAEVREHRARESASTFEWGVESQTFVDGDFDRIYPGWNGRLYTEEEAREDAKAWTKSKYWAPSRVVRRLVGAWEAVSPDE